MTVKEDIVTAYVINVKETKLAKGCLKKKDVAVYYSLRLPRIHLHRT